MGADSRRRNRSKGRGTGELEQDLARGALGTGHPPQTWPFAHQFPGALRMVPSSWNAPCQHLALPLRSGKQLGPLLFFSFKVRV